MTTEINFLNLAKTLNRLMSFLFLVKEGDKVQKDQGLFEIETDKVND
jgi:biotin carboxyl carrier protein